MAVVTSLSFAGRTEEALDFYRETLDAETVFLMRYSDSPDQSHLPPGMENKIFHATFRIEGTNFMASDVGCVNEGTIANPSVFSLVLQLDCTARANRIFNALTVGGQILVPLAKSAFTSWYGIVIDRFGISGKVCVSDDDGQSVQE